VRGNVRQNRPTGETSSPARSKNSPAVGIDSDEERDVATFSPAEISTPNRAPSLATTIIAVGAVIALLYYGRDFFVTLITGITVGFLLDPFVDMLMKLRLPRFGASFVVCSLTVAAVYLVGVGIYFQAAGLLGELPQYSQRMTEVIDQGTRAIQSTEDKFAALLPHRKASVPPVTSASAATTKRKNAPPAAPATPFIQEVRISEESAGILVPYLQRNWEAVGHWILLLSFIPFMVYFTLSWRDHLRRSYLSLFNGADRHAAGRAWQGIGDMARAYVIGNFLLGLFLTLASGAVFWAVKVPYWPLVAPISGFLSLVPYVGLPMAILPPVLVSLPAFQQLAPYVMIALVVAFLHLLALNLLYPKLVGSRVHLNPLAVTVALMFWGVLWGPLGLLFGIPITAGMKAVFDNVPSLNAYGRLLGD
jgi:predicted PurR-regulated permease PerM